WVELCHRQLKPGDYSWGGFYYGIIGIPDHYWIHTSSPDPNCQSIGYGPGGIWHDTGNLGAGSYSDIQCVPVPITASQLACLCRLPADAAADGTKIDNTTYCDTSCRDKNGNPIHDYNFLTHNCQDFAIDILSECGIRPRYWSEWDN